MRISEPLNLDAFTIYEGRMPPNRGVLDPVTVILQDMGGCGRIIVECYGAAWSCYFGAIGCQTLRQFIAGCDPHYLAGKLATVTHRCTTKKEESYLVKIARNVIAALKGGAA